MKVTTEITDTRVVTLSIEPDADRMQEAKRRAATALSRWRPVPGFRPGRAPLAMVERIFGAETVLKEAVNSAAEDIFRQAVQEASIEPLQPGELEIESTDPLRLKVQVALVPVVRLGDYRSLHVTPEPEAKVAEGAIDAEIEALRENAATYEPVDRPIMATDKAVLELTASQDDEIILQEEAFEVTVSPQEEPYPLVDKLLAMRVGESAEVDAEYLEEYQNKTLAGKLVHLQLTVKAVREKTLPELNDEFAKDVGEHDTLAELRQSRADVLQQNMDNARRGRETEAAIKALVEASEVEYPAAAVDRELEAMLQNERARVQRYGFDWENYLRITHRTEEQLRAEARPRAEQRLVRGLVLGDFARAEGLQVAPTEIFAELDRLATQYGERAEEARKQLLQSGALSSIENDLLSHTTVEHVVAVLTGRVAPNAVAPATGETTAPEAAGLSAAEQETDIPAAEAPAPEQEPDA